MRLSNGAKRAIKRANALQNKIDRGRMGLGALTYGDVEEVFEEILPELVKIVTCQKSEKTENKSK